MIATCRNLMTRETAEFVADLVIVAHGTLTPIGSTVSFMIN